MREREGFPAGVPAWIDTNQPDPTGAAPDSASAASTLAEENRPFPRHEAREVGIDRTGGDPAAGSGA